MHVAVIEDAYPCECGSECVYVSVRVYVFVRECVSVLLLADQPEPLGAGRRAAVRALQT